MSIVERVRSLDKAQAYFLTSETNVSYVTGFSGDSSEVLVTDTDICFFTDARYTLQAQSDVRNAQVITTTAQERAAAIGDILFDNRIDTLAIEKDSMTINDFDAYHEIFDMSEYIDISYDLLEMRSIKTNEEIRKIKTAAKGNENVLHELVKAVRPGMSEFDIRAELVYQINKQGMDCAFAPIVAGGVDSAIPHATVSGYRVKNGDMLTLDFGCKYKGYCSDITRTFAIGNVDEQLKKIYDIVKSAQQMALDTAGAGVKASAVDAAARDTISAGGYGGYYRHGTGHGVGLDIHERPVVNALSTDTIRENMVYTVEPGIYIPGVGGVRIEDMCVGGEGNLYEFSKELIYI